MLQALDSLVDFFLNFLDLRLAQDQVLQLLIKRIFVLKESINVFLRHLALNLLLKIIEAPLAESHWRRSVGLGLRLFLACDSLAACVCCLTRYLSS